jgi:hypothetical protein
MNVFGAFTFGALIKTFLPGFVWLAALAIGETELAAVLGWPSVWEFIKQKDSLAAVLAVPSSILLGLISNILVFMGLNDWLVRAPVRRDAPQLFGLYDELSARMRGKCWSAVACNDKFQGAFKDHIDVELMILHKVGVNTLAYIREQYWFHLEFQMNLFLSLTAIAFVACFYFGRIHGMIGVAATLVVVAAVDAFLVSAARKNYCRHIAKMASMMAAVLCPADKETPTPAKGWFR